MSEMINYEIFAIFICLVQVVVGQSMDEEVINSAEGQLENRMCEESITDNSILLNCSGLSLERVDISSQVHTSSITKLDLSNNVLLKLECSSFSNLITLRYLNLSANHIKVIDSGTFSELTQIEKLDISSNLLESVSLNLFSPLANLKYLDLSHNRLHKLPFRLPMLDWFDISNNLISSLSEIPFSALLYPQHVFLLGKNPLTCDCDLLWLKELLDTRKYILKFSIYIDKEKFFPRCSQPKELEGQSWEFLIDSDFKCSDSLQTGSDEMSTSGNIVASEGLSVITSETRTDSVVVEWVGVESKDLSETSIEIKYHQFGKKNTVKTVVLPLQAQSYRIRKLQPGSPYVICYKIETGQGNILQQECLEVITKAIVKKSRHTIIGYIISMFQIPESSSLVVTFTVVIVVLSVILMKFLLKGGTTLEK